MPLLNLAMACIGIIALIRSASLLFFAETGRKQDLIKHIYKSGTSFHIAVVIPFTPDQAIGPLQDLIQALSKQDYPREHIQIHIGATDSSAKILSAYKLETDQVKIWRLHEDPLRQNRIVSWLVDRLLAAGGPSRLFVFLEPNDIVRPDFLKNVTSRAFDCHAMQGYLAHKRPPEGWVASISALSTRLINRIENAGRFHMGLSCRLLRSGWVIRQELLEMIPFHQGADLDNLEYTARLNLHQYRVHWAPNMVVYRDERLQFKPVVSDAVDAVLNRIKLLGQYGVPLLMRGLTRLDLSALEDLAGMIRPPAFILGLLFVLWAAGQLHHASVHTATFILATVIAVGFIVLQALALAVARCPLKDAFLFLVATPFVYVAALALFPVLLVWNNIRTLPFIKPQPKAARMGRRFDESQPSKPAPQTVDTQWDDAVYASSEENAHYSYTAIQPDNSLSAKDFSQIYSQKLNDVSQAQSVLFQTPVPTVLTLPLSNGQQSVACQITVLYAVESNTYQLVFAYKSLTFATHPATILDEAYYALLDKLQAKGFRILSCGGCRQFAHTPYSPAMGQTQEQGLCLYRQAHFDPQDASRFVTVLSPTCQAYQAKSLSQTDLKVLSSS